MLRFLLSSAVCLAVLTLSAQTPDQSLPTPVFEGLTNFDATPWFVPGGIDMAVGPTDILVMVNGRLGHLLNPNADGAMIPPSVRPNPAVQSVDASVDLLQWLGTPVLDELCPTKPRSASSCTLASGTVAYDQMQGRFLVLFTVTDSGYTQTSTSSTLTSPRRATWVLAVSRFASLTDSGIPPLSQPVPADKGTDAMGTSNWYAYYGPAQGFGPSGAPLGNVNHIPGIADSARYFNCAPNAGAPRTTPQSKPTSACYFPTDTRLGIDNNTITLVSPVLNINATLDFNNAPGPTNTQFAGTRIRVVKKAAIYNAVPQLTPGNQYASDVAARTSGDFYDLFTTMPGSTSPVTGAPFTPFTVVNNPAAPNLPAFFEPSRLRGPTEFSFTDFGSDTTPAVSQSFLAGALAASGIQTSLQIQPIQLVFPYDSPLTGASPFYPSLVNRAQITVPSFADPKPVPQQKSDSIASPPNLYVGDGRPQKVVFREGHLYAAHTVSDPAVAQAQSVVRLNVFSGIPNAFQPPYVNLLGVGSKGANTFGPMFDVPADVPPADTTVNPINLFPWLEKLFVASTLPPLGGLPDPAARLKAPGGDPAYQFGATGLPIVGPLVNGKATDVCGRPGTAPGGFSFPGIFDTRCGEDVYNNNQFWENPANGGYFGSGNVATPITFFGVNGAAQTDPNTGGLWLYGQYATKRKAGDATGNWGTWGAYRPPFINPAFPFFSDVAPDSPYAFPFYVFALRGIAGADPNLDPNSAGPGQSVTWPDMANWLVRSQMDENAITKYLQATGGLQSSFPDVDPGQSSWRYIETMYRRGYTKGCTSNPDGPTFYCPGTDSTTPLTRGQMAVFIIRAKMNNVFPSVLEGCQAAPPGPGCPASGDNFGFFVPQRPYFQDVGPDSQYFNFIQKMRELRITTGTPDGNFRPDDPATRGDLVTFLVRAFFN